MTIDNIDVKETLKRVQLLLDQEPNLSPALRSTLEVLILVVQLMIGRLSLSSRNSSKPPSTDCFPSRKKPKEGEAKNPGGQKGRVGTTLKKVEDPDRIEHVPVDRSTLPEGEYTEVGYEARQVFDIQIQRVVTEYRAQILEDAKGRRFIATFPPDVSKAVQYGNGVKAQAVYQSQYQLIPYNRVQEYFRDQLELPISQGSVFNFNQEASAALAQFELTLLNRLLKSRVLHGDETGININGTNHWLHCVSNSQLTLFYAHPKRGMEAMESKAALPHFEGILVHDHWKPYFNLKCQHALCNAHHLRELTYAHEQENQQWAEAMRILLLEIHEDVKTQGGELSKALAQAHLKAYRKILAEANAECPEPIKPAGQKGRIKRSKSRNLLERLIHFETETLRFMTDPDVPFTNNQGEHDIRMTKVHQKISGCFRSQDGADIFCRVRSYLSTCAKNNVSSSDALNLLFEGKLPDFLGEITR